jgi:alkylation response protein AidB-like acyl-CoA dehydrogenase
MAATANWTWTMYPGLSKGAINTIIAHGSDEMKEKWLPPLVEGRYTGTMCLTEPQCGSDLGLVSTKAEPNGDGTYKITGTKIFISCGEHDMVDNIVHCVLARLPGAPEGTRGISLFLVPKKKVGADGALSDEMNGCKIGRIEDKMGCHGSSTCEINFEEAEGTLIGTENKGLNHMFTFINTSRIGTAVQGVAAAELSYQGALWYAKDRLAMRSLTGVKNEDGPADPIIVHPDVRKMLLTQRCIAEAGRSMVYECALLNDHKMEAEANGDAAEVKRIEGQMHFLTPILKGFLTEVGVEAANLGIQIYGGHGYIKSNKQEQVLRDVRISAVWEGTTGIQALDLLGRKIMMGKLKPINEHCAKLRKEAWSLMTGGSSPSVKKHAFTLFKRACEWQYITYKVGADTASNKDALGIASVDYLMYSGYVGMAHHWLMMEEAAAKALAKGDGADLEQPKEFYEAKLQTAAFYYENILPRTETLTTTMFTPVETVMGMHEDHFSFDHAR